MTPEITIGAKVKLTIGGVEYEGVIVHGRVVPRDEKAPASRASLAGVRMEATIQIADAPDERRQHPMFPGIE